ncbi:MAG: helix-turn-helix transcriptional regulator [Rhodoplanes sp.]|uniref:helix-turn-helix transcriptional regulator n=1 Tax=Rhodoplanes sp. TaxID=1968906 RepID=UPI00181A17A0|nr:helix-turn-helix transcriptional regulator [Rhodoplanes sp.]NVO14480.1 helix-turn-helix transcriptional regulator [Rhodoplanes sp.]
MKVRFEATPNGEMAILPRAEYERLVALAAEAEEDAGTARLVAKARKEIAAGTPVLPLSVADALADGENPIRVLRTFRGFTQAQLAVAAELTQGYLSDLESGKRKGPLELHQRLARALGVPLDLLAPMAVSPEEADPERFAKRKRVIADMQKRRNRR